MAEWFQVRPMVDAAMTEPTMLERLARKWTEDRSDRWEPEINLADARWWLRAVAEPPPKANLTQPAKRAAHRGPNTRRR